jgi:hypothetical protein
LRTRTARQDSSGPHALRYMMTTLLTWQARAAGETWRVAPWKRSIHSKIREEQSCSDSAACVLESAHSSSAAANLLTTCSQQQATLAREVTMSIPRATAFVWCASAALDQHSAGVNGHEAQQTKRNGSAVWISLNDREKKSSYCVKKSSFTDLLRTPDRGASLQNGASGLGRAGRVLEARTLMPQCRMRNANGRDRAARYHAGS